MDQDWKEVALALGGIVTGFLLSEVANYFRSRREERRQGESLDFEIAALKPVLNSQILDLKGYYVNVKNYQNESPATHREHPLHEAIKTYNEEGLDIIAEMQKQTKDFLLMIFYITRAIEFCYKDLYEPANTIRG